MAYPLFFFFFAMCFYSIRLALVPKSYLGTLRDIAYISDHEEATWYILTGEANSTPVGQCPKSISLFPDISTLLLSHFSHVRLCVTP